MNCQDCPYLSMCGQFSDPNSPCQNFDAFKREEEEWYQEEMQYQENLNSMIENMYSYDEDGFCDGFPR